MPSAEEHINNWLAQIGLSGSRIGTTQIIGFGGRDITIKYHVRTNVREWLLSERDDTRTNDFYCFICFSNLPTVEPDDWLVPGKIVNVVLRRSHLAWLAQPESRVRQQGPLRKFRLDYSAQFPELRSEYGPGWAEPFHQPSAWEQIR